MTLRRQAGPATAYPRDRAALSAPELFTAATTFAIANALVEVVAFRGIIQSVLVKTLLSFVDLAIFSSRVDCRGASDSGLLPSISKP